MTYSLAISGGIEVEFAIITPAGRTRLKRNVKYIAPEEIMRVMRANLAAEIGIYVHSFLTVAGLVMTT